MAKAHLHRPPTDKTVPEVQTDEIDPVDPSVELPSSKALKPEWVAFAVGLGKDPEEAEALTIAELEGWAKAELALDAGQD